MSGLRPDGEEGRDLLRRELLRPEYNREDPIGRILDWLGRRLDDGLSAAGSADPLVALAGMVTLLLLGVAVAWLVARTRTERPGRRRRDGVLDDVRDSAAQVRARAEAELAAGRHEEALLEAYRALALRQVEAGRLADLPGATAREIADSLAADEPSRADDARRAAYLFDGVRYGDRRVSAEQVTDVLRLDDALAGVR